MLYGRRKRLKKLAEDEESGASFWSHELDEAARYKLVYAVRALVNETGGPYATFDLLDRARLQVLESDGIPSLADGSTLTNMDEKLTPSQVRKARDYIAYLQNRDCIPSQQKSKHGKYSHCQRCKGTEHVQSSANPLSPLIGMLARGAAGSVFDVLLAKVRSNKGFYKGLCDGVGIQRIR